MSRRKTTVPFPLPPLTISSHSIETTSLSGMSINLSLVSNTNTRHCGLRVIAHGGTAPLAGGYGDGGTKAAQGHRCIWPLTRIVALHCRYESLGMSWKWMFSGWWHGGV